MERKTNSFLFFIIYRDRLIKLRFLKSLFCDAKHPIPAYIDALQISVKYTIDLLFILQFNWNVNTNY
jgi:hypothetical protein